MNAPHVRDSTGALMPAPHEMRGGTATEVIVLIVAFGTILLWETLSGDSPTVAMVGALALLSIPALLSYRRGTLSAVGPEVVLPIAIYLSALHAAVFRTLTGGRPLDRFEVVVIMDMVPAAFASSLVLILLPAWLPAFRRPVPLTSFDTLERVRLHVAGGFLASGIGTALFLSWILSVGVSNLMSASYVDMYLLSAGQSTMTFAWPFVFVGVATTSRSLARWPGKIPLGLRVAQASLIGAYLLFFARLGVRSVIFELLISVAIARAGTPRPVGRALTALAGGVAVVLYLLVSTVRGNLSGGLSTTTDALSATVQHNTDPNVMGEFDAVLANSSDMVRFAGSVLPLREGQTYLDIPVELLPRQLVGDKPEGLSVWWIRYIDPNAADLGGGRAFSSFAEGYLNFGSPGAIAQIVIVTAILFFAYALLRVRIVGFAGAGAMVLAHSYYSHRSELVHMLYNARNGLLVAASMALCVAVIEAMHRRQRTGLFQG